MGVATAAAQGFSHAKSNVNTCGGEARTGGCGRIEGAKVEEDA